MDTKSSYEDVKQALDEKISKQDLHYYLANKISYEEAKSILDGKSNMHEVNVEI